jgi:type I restriction enzyme S subunit
MTVADPTRVDDLWLEPGDIFIERSNTPELVGTTRRYGGPRRFAIFPDLLIRVRLVNELPGRYVELALQSPLLRRYFRRSAQGIAGSMPKIDQGAVERAQIPVAPLAEQLRIVAEIEKHLTRLDAAVAALERIRARLKQYRASVMKAACEGRLVPTEAELARAEGRDYEPASVLLNRILRERRARWETEQCAKMKAGGKIPRDDRWKARYREPEPAEAADLPELPSGWSWTMLVALAALKGGIAKGQKRRDVETLRSVPYLRVANVQRGHLDLSEVKLIQASEDEIEELHLHPGDVLFNEGGDRDKLGRGWIWNGEIPECIHQNHVFRARLYVTEVEPKFVSWYGNTFGQKYFFDEGKQTTNLASVNMTKLGVLPVPLPPVAEQQRIVPEVERRLSVVDEIEATVVTNLRRVGRLRQTILRLAFEGKLVPQDPSDEPATVLLERIRADRAASSESRPQGRRARRRRGAPERVALPEEG